MSEKANNSGLKIYAKDFAGTKTTCMKDYMEPSSRNAPNHFILHVGTNEFDSKKTAENIANSIIYIATYLKK